MKHKWTSYSCRLCFNLTAVNLSLHLYDLSLHLYDHTDSNWCIPSPGVLSALHHPSTLHLKHSRSATAPHLQQHMSSEQQSTVGVKHHKFNVIIRTTSGTYSEFGTRWSCPALGSARGLLRAAFECNSCRSSECRDWQTCRPMPCSVGSGSMRAELL